MKLTDLDETILTDVIKPRPQESYKGTFGKILLVGGNHQFGGAIMMATAAAVYSGTGLVTVACDPTNITALHTQLPEAMAIDFTDKAALTGMIKRVNTVVVGPGLGEGAGGMIAQHAGGAGDDGHLAVQAETLGCGLLHNKTLLCSALER